MHFPSDGFSVGVVSGGGQHNPHRLTACVTGTKRHNVPQVAARLGVQLVKDNAARLVAMLAVRLTGQHLEPAAARLVVDGLGAVHDAAALFERRTLLDHVLGRRKDDARVVAVSRHDIHLAVDLAVGKQVVHTQTGSDFRLAVLLGDLQIEILVSPQIAACRVVLVLDQLTVKLGYHAALPVHQAQRHTAGARQALQKIADKLRLLLVKHPLHLLRYRLSKTNSSLPCRMAAA